MYLLKMKHPSAERLTGFAITLLVAAMLCGTLHAAQTQVKQKTFATPEDAVQAMVQAVTDNNDKELSAVFGPDFKPLLLTTDNAVNEKNRKKFIKRYNEKNRIEASGNAKAVLHVGANDWPFPIPIVKAGSRWHFDTKLGRQEVLSRRIGKNELGSIQTCLAVVDAEREYASVDRNGNSFLEYTPKMKSAKGKTDGLYWETKPGEKLSPLGPLVANAQVCGIKGEKPVPYNGYFYRMLLSQGKDARGGAYSYTIKGRMIGGFALVAYPAVYGATGVKTFITNYDGVVYEKDLGVETAQKALAIKSFNPDKTWKKTE